ncbi:FCD domain-containing protein [Salinarimonas sp.]|uniref:GntR family transcriptional regulator n=1 Tax=Salinarimonas sp. TaxID=2766526 RepID=UPI0032D8E04B
MRTASTPTSRSPEGRGASEASLVDAAYAALRSDIIAGRRRPDERLRMERLRTIYGIGVTPLREALQRLAADGLVVATGSRGFSVARLAAADFADLNRARIAVETAALRLSIPAGDDDWEADVVAAAYALEKQDRLLQSGEADLERWEAANARFHHALVKACGTEWLLRVRQNLQDQCERYRRASIGAERRARDLMSEHREIARAALARDVAATCALVEAHFQRTGEGLDGFLTEPAAATRPSRGGLASG